MTTKHEKRAKSSKKKYLRPGILAQVCNSKSSSRAFTYICRKNILLSWKDTSTDILPHNPIINADTTESPVRIPSVQVVGKSGTRSESKLSTTPKSPRTLEYDSESRLESLPIDLLVKILCFLHHDQLRPVFHVSRRIRTAVIVAREYHFNYTTPNRATSASKKIERSTASTPDAPGAPKHAPRCNRFLPNDSRQVSMVLFPERILPEARRIFPGSSLHALRKCSASNRILFWEDDLCHAIAKNKLR